MATHLRNSSDSTSDSSFTTTQRNIHWVDDDQPPGNRCLSSSSDSLCSSGLDESDEYTAELTRRMAHYMLQDFDDPPLLQEEEKQGNSFTEFRKKQALIDEQIRFVQIQRRKQEGTAKEEQEEGKEEGTKQPPQGRKKRGKKKGQKGPPEVMTAVFLGVPGGGRAASGTGVFLPAAGGVENRTTSTTAATSTSSSPESRSKPGCSTVLMPGRVVQALKLHFDKMGPSPSPTNPPAAAAVASSMHFQQGALTDNVRYAFQLQQRSSESSPPNPGKNPRHQRRRFEDTGLPQEWTY